MYTCTCTCIHIVNNGLTSSLSLIISESLSVMSVSYFMLASLSCSVVFIKVASTSFLALSSKANYTRN